MRQRVLVCGGRDFSQKEILFNVLDEAHAANPIDCLIHGAARGADQLAADWALDRGILCKAYPADWAHEGRGAGPKRNQRMLDLGKPHIVIAFPGGRGTEDMMERARKAGVPIATVTVNRT
jgi:hypothetical protein